MSEEVVKFSFSGNWQEKRVWFYVSLVFLLLILLLGTYIRTTNIDNLKDQTTGNYTLAPDLDPFLYLRLAGELVTYGELQNPDYFRNHGIEPYQNFLPYGIFYLYKIGNLLLGDFSLQYAAIIFPVIFFGLSIIVFFFFIREIFHDREEFQKGLIAILATALYSVVPLMQHRTTAGVPELESAGLFFFWLSFYFFLFSLRDEKKIFGFDRSYLFALLSGISTCLMIFTWGGFRFILYTISATILFSFLTGNVKKRETLIYFLWFLPTTIFLVYIRGINATIFDVTISAIPTFVLAILFVNFIITERMEEKIKSVLKKDWLNRQVISFAVTIIIGFLALLIIKPDFALNFIFDLRDRLLYPFGRERVGVTVAENQQLYLINIFGSFGKVFFWLFFFGTIFLFSEIIKKLEKKEKIILNTSFVIFVTGFLFSRYSPSSIFNGENLISQMIYFGAVIVLLGSWIYVYYKNIKGDFKLEKLKEIKSSYILLLFLIILMMVASRGAIRLLVISSPIFVIAAAFLPVYLLDKKTKTSDDFWKVVLLILLLVSVFYFAVTFKGYEEVTAQSVKASVPSIYETQWQYAMAWVRGNTPEMSTFIHWWDYGYWIQTIGERPTMTDGGHAIGYWNHLNARYVLTTQKSETALSFMKTHNISYLLIDSTDLGKYPAYSSIGSDENGKDRLSQIPVMVVDNTRIQREGNKTTRIYQGGTVVDQDIIYDDNGTNVFIPQDNSVIAGVILEVNQNGTSITFSQPRAVFMYNQKQITIPMRYLYYNEQMIDFSGGLDAVAKIIPAAGTDSNQQIQIDSLGGLIYLSPKVSKGLFAELYLLNDWKNKYPTIKLVHSQDDLVISNFKSQGAQINDFIYYQGFRGPIKIWEVNYPRDVVEREEFLRQEGRYGEFDNLQFTV